MCLYGEMLESGEPLNKLEFYLISVTKMHLFGGKFNSLPF